jgi:hypothetical protein
MTHETIDGTTMVLDVQRLKGTNFLIYFRGLWSRFFVR